MGGFGLVFSIEILSDGGDLTKLELGDGHAAPTLGGADLVCPQ